MLLSCTYSFFLANKNLFHSLEKPNTSSQKELENPICISVEPRPTFYEGFPRPTLHVHTRRARPKTSQHISWHKPNYKLFKTYNPIGLSQKLGLKQKTIKY